MATRSDNAAAMAGRNIVLVRRIRSLTCQYTQPRQDVLYVAMGTAPRGKTVGWLLRGGGKPLSPPTRHTIGSATSTQQKRVVEHYQGYREASQPQNWRRHCRQPTRQALRGAATRLSSSTGVTACKAPTKPRHNSEEKHNNGAACDVYGYRLQATLCVLRTVQAWGLDVASRR